MRSWATVQHAQHLRQQQQQRQAVPRQETAAELLLLNAVRRQMQAVCGDVLTSCCLLVDTTQPGWPVVYCNDSWKLWSGISRKQTQGRPLQSLLAPARLGTAGLRWAQLQEQAAAGGPFVICDVAAVQAPLNPCMGHAHHAPASAASGQHSPVDLLSGATSTILAMQQDGGVEEGLGQSSPAADTGAGTNSSMRREGQVEGPAQLQPLGEGDQGISHPGANPCATQAGQACPSQAQEQQRGAADQQHTAMLVNAMTKRPAYNSTPHDLDMVLRRPQMQGGRASLDATWAARPALAMQLPQLATSTDAGRAPAAQQQQQQQQHADELTTLWDRLEAAQCAASASTEGSSGQQIHTSSTRTCRPTSNPPHTQQAVTSPVKGDHVLGTGDGAILGELAARLRSGAGAADVADSGAAPTQQPSSTSFHPATGVPAPAGPLEAAGVMPRPGVRWSATAVAAGAAAGAATRSAAGGTRARTQLRVLPELLQQQQQPQQQQQQVPAVGRGMCSSGFGSGAAVCARASGLSSGTAPWDVGRRSSWLYGTGSGLHSTRHSGVYSGDALLSTNAASETATTEDLLEELTLKDEAGRAAKASHFANEVRAHGIHLLRAPHAYGHHARAHATATAPHHLQRTASCSHGMADAACHRDHDGADGRSTARQYSPAVQPGSTSGLTSPMTSQTPRGPLQVATATPPQATPSSICALPEALVQGRNARRVYAKQFTQQPPCVSHAGSLLHTSGPAPTPSFAQEQQDSGQGSAAAGLHAGLVTGAGPSAPSPGTLSPKAAPTRVAAAAAAAAETAAAAPTAGAAAAQPGLPSTLNSTLAHGCLGTSFNLSFHPLALHRLDKQAPRVELPPHAHMRCAAHMAGLYVVHVHAMGVLPAPEEPLLPGAKVEHASNASPAVLAQFLWPGLQLGDMLGWGAYGAAFVGVWHGLEVVVKVHDVTVNNAQELADAQLEVELGQELGHRNLVQTLSHAAVQLPQPAPDLQQPCKDLPRAHHPASPTAALHARRPGQAAPRGSTAAICTVGVDVNPTDAGRVLAPADGNAARFLLLGSQQAEGASTTEARAPPAATNPAVGTASEPAPAAPHAAPGMAGAAVMPPHSQQQQHGTYAAGARTPEASMLQTMLQPSPGCFLLGAPAAAMQLPDVMHSSHSGAGHGSLLLLSDEFAHQDAAGAVDGPHSLDLQLGYGGRGLRALSGGAHALPPASSPLPDLKEHAAIGAIHVAAGPDGQQQSSVCDAQQSTGTATCAAGGLRYVPMHVLTGEGGQGNAGSGLPATYVENSAGRWSRAGLAAASPHTTREGAPSALHLRPAAPAAPPLTEPAAAPAASMAGVADAAAGAATADAQAQGSQWDCPVVHPGEDGQPQLRVSEAGSINDAGEGHSSGCSSGSTRASPVFPLHLRCMQLMELCDAGTLQQAIDNCLLHSLGPACAPSQNNPQAATAQQHGAPHGVPAADACIAGCTGAASPAAAPAGPASPAAGPAPCQHRPLPHLPKLLCLAHDICSALAHMHAHGVVHADLSANNVLLAKCPARVQLSPGYRLALGEAADELPPSSAPGLASVDAVGAAWRAVPGAAAATPEASLPVHLAADMQMRLGPRPSNQLDDPWFIAKVSDLGKSRLVAPQAQLQVGAYATITHMAPEVLQHKTISHAGDVFSLGVLLWQMYTGQRAWRGMPRQQVFDAVVSGRRLEWPHDTHPAALADLGRACCHMEPAARPTAQQVLQVLQELLHQQGCFLQELQEVQQLHACASAAAGPAG